MANQTMADYLPTKTADVSTTLSVTPQHTLVEAPKKSQVVNKFDDGGVSVFDINSADFFDVTLQWDVISTEESGTILDLWMTCNGSGQTFKWQHPTDGNIYVARFMEPLKRVHKSNMPNNRAISQTKLRIHGVV